MMLKDQVQKIVSTTIVERSETRYTIDLVDEIHDLIEKMIQYSIKDEVSSISGIINESLIKLREDGEKVIEEIRERVEEENNVFKKSVQEMIKQLKKQLMDDKLRIDQKISNLNKNST